MFQRPENTTIGGGMGSEQLADLIKQNLIRNDNEIGSASQLMIVGSAHDDYYICGFVEGKGINPKPFINPVTFNHGDDTFLVFDARPMTRFDRRENKHVVKDPTNFKRDVTRVVLQSIWTDEGPRAILRLSIAFQVKIFTRWVADTLSMRYALAGDQAGKLAVLCAFYYLCLFTDAKSVDKRKTALIITRALHLNMNYVEEVLHNVDYITDLPSFIDIVNSTLETERLRGLNYEVMVTLLKGTWFGVNSAIIVATALEYPPTFVSMLYLSLTDASTRISGLARLALGYEKDPAAKDFKQLTENLLKVEID